jgi:biopolymer transport protein ExbD
MLKEDGKVFLNRDVMADMADLQAQLKRAMRGKRYSQRVVFFDADDKAKYGSAVSVLDAVRGANVAVIGMMTERPQLAPAPAEGELPPEAGAAPGLPPGPP